TEITGRPEHTGTVPKDFLPGVVFHKKKDKPPALMDGKFMLEFLKTTLVPIDRRHSEQVYYYPPMVLVSPWPIVLGCSYNSQCIAK
ncbi:4517_t:CDS:2, partial [Paraglomus brasilianum]